MDFRPAVKCQATDDMRMSTNTNPNHGHNHEDFMPSEKLTMQTQKPFKTLSAIGIGYGTTNSAIGLLVVLGTAIPLGGSPLFFWGFLVMVMIALAELASAMPHPGGQHIWVSELAPARVRRGLPYCTAMLGWPGAVATGASACPSVSTGVCGVMGFPNPGFVYARWMGFVGFQLLDGLTVACAAFEHALPGISQGMLLVSCASCPGVFGAPFATSRESASVQGFLLTGVKTPGWADGVGFLVGMGGINRSLRWLDVATHLAEEIPSPATNIPKALMWTVAVGAVSGLLVIVAVFAHLPSLADVVAAAVFVLLLNVRGGGGCPCCVRSGACSSRTRGAALRRQRQTGDAALHSWRCGTKDSSAGGCSASGWLFPLMGGSWRWVLREPGMGWYDVAWLELEGPRYVGSWDVCACPARGVLWSGLLLRGRRIHQSGHEPMDG